MKTTARSATLLLALLSAALALPACKTTAPTDGGAGGTPRPPLTTVLVDCAQTIGGPVVGDEIPKIVTALTSDDVAGGLQNVISEITSAGFLTTEAFAFTACVVRNELGRAQRDGDLGDAAALRRANAADRWLIEQGVVFAPPPTAPPSARKAGK